MTRDAATWTNYAEALAFVGNSLLAPMNQTGTVGLEPEFWASFPSFDDVHVAVALEALEGYANAAQQSAAEGDNPVQDASVDYTKLFVGPPRPAAAPWETMYRPGSEGATVGFGQATFEMKALLRDAGLEVSNENNQYADHIGIELLYASVLCTRLAEADGDAAAQEELEKKLESFLQIHPLTWIDKLQAAVAETAPASYIACVLALAQALLASL